MCERGLKWWRSRCKFKKGASAEQRGLHYECICPFRSHFAAAHHLFHVLSSREPYTTEITLLLKTRQQARSMDIWHFLSTSQTPAEWQYSVPAIYVLMTSLCRLCGCDSLSSAALDYSGYGHCCAKIRWIREPVPLSGASFSTPWSISSCRVRLVDILLSSSAISTKIYGSTLQTSLWCSFISCMFKKNLILE